MARQPGLNHELVLIDQSQLRQRQRELHASHQQSLTRLPLELLNGLPQIPAHELRVPIDPVQGARHDVLLCRVDRPGEGFHPIRPRSRPRRRPPRCLHHFVSHPAKEEGIGLLEVLDHVTKQVFVREHCTMIAAPVQCDVDGIPKRSHYVRVPIAIGRPNETELSHRWRERVWQIRRTVSLNQNVDITAASGWLQRLVRSYFGSVSFLCSARIEWVSFPRRSCGRQAHGISRYASVCLWPTKLGHQDRRLSRRSFVQKFSIVLSQVLHLSKKDTALR